MHPVGGLEWAKPVWFHQCRKEGAKCPGTSGGVSWVKNVKNKNPPQMTQQSGSRSSRLVGVQCTVVVAVVGCTAVHRPWVEVVPCQDVQLRSHQHCEARTSQSKRSRVR